MINKCIVIFFISMLLSTHFVKSQEFSLSSSKESKYHLSICAIFKNEAEYLKEWIEYHRIFGVDHFYLYNMGSQDTFQKILTPYINQGIVSLIDWPELKTCCDDCDVCRWALTTQVTAYENALNFLAKYETKWLIFIDIDEFLVCSKGIRIEEFLKKYDDYPGISVSSDYFDAVKPPASLSQDRLLIQTSWLTKPPKKNVEKEVSKMIFKPVKCEGFQWPPYECKFKNNETCMTVDSNELRINRYLNRNVHSLREQKKFRPDPGRCILTKKEKESLLDLGFVIEDQERLMDQHIPELLKRIGQE